LRSARASRAGSGPAKANLYIGGGNFKPSDDGVLLRRDGEYSFDCRLRLAMVAALGGGNRLAVLQPGGGHARGARHFGTGSDKASLSSSGFGGLVKLVQPVGSADFFAGAGVGHYESKLSASSINALTFQTRTVSRSDSNWGYQYVAGVDLRASPNVTWTFQYRRVVLDATSVPGIGVTKTGGWMWQILLRATFGSCRECLLGLRSTGIVSPPETLITCPVMNAASSEARKATMPGMSSGWPTRFMGMARTSAS
jgi:opacity protein-like surface antigen